MAADKTKNLRMILDKRLSFEYHITDKINQANKGIGVMKQLYCYLPRIALEFLYKLYVRPHLDYGDVVYQIPDNESKTFDSKDDNFHHLMTRVESVQYQAACVVSGAWRCSSRKKLYNDLGWESLYHRRNLRRLSYFMMFKKINFRSILSATLIPANLNVVYAY